MEAKNSMIKKKKWTRIERKRLEHHDRISGVSSIYSFLQRVQLKAREGKGRGEAWTVLQGLPASAGRGFGVDFSTGRRGESPQKFQGLMKMF